MVFVFYMFFLNILDPAAGASDDWYRGGLGTRYSFTTELRDTGYYGFVLPPELSNVCQLLKLGSNPNEYGQYPKISMIRGCSTILPKNFSLCFVCRWNSFLPAQLSNACQWSVSAHFKILQGRSPAGKVFPSKQFLIMILKLVVDRKCLCVLGISVKFRITHVCEIMCEY